MPREQLPWTPGTRGWFCEQLSHGLGAGLGDGVRTAHIRNRHLDPSYVRFIGSTLLGGSNATAGAPGSYVSEGGNSETTHHSLPAEQPGASQATKHGLEVHDPWTGGWELIEQMLVELCSLSNVMC